MAFGRASPLRERLPCRSVFLTTIFQFGCAEMLFVVFVVAGGAADVAVIGAPFASIDCFKGLVGP